MNNKILGQEMRTFMNTVVKKTTYMLHIVAYLHKKPKSH